MFRVLRIPSGTKEPVFDPSWLAAHSTDLDVVHLHSCSALAEPAELAAWVLELHRNELPLVLTVTDLWAAGTDISLGILVADAAAVLALNEADAAELARRWGRTAEVLPPHLDDEDSAAVLRGIHARVYGQLARVKGTPAV